MRTQADIMPDYVVFRSEYSGLKLKT